MFFLFLLGCSKNNKVFEDNSLNGVECIEIQTGPYIKKITESKDIDNVLEWLKSIKYTSKVNIENDDPNGWNYWIRTYDTQGKVINSVSFVNNNMIKYNNNWYIIKPSVSEEIHSIYEHLNYPEVHYSEQ